MKTPPAEWKLLIRESVAVIKRLANTPHDAGASVAQDIGKEVGDIDRLAKNKQVGERCRVLLAAADDVYVAPMEDTKQYIEARSNRRAQLYTAIQELEVCLQSLGLLPA